MSDLAPALQAPRPPGTPPAEDAYERRRAGRRDRRSAPELPWPREARGGVMLGIDLEARMVRDDPRAPPRPDPWATEGQTAAEAVRRLVLALRLPDELDREDVVQEVMTAIVKKNRQPSAWDPRRASFSKYVHQVANSTICNMLAKQRRHRCDSLDDDPELADRLPCLADNGDPEAVLEAEEAVFAAPLPRVARKLATSAPPPAVPTAKRFGTVDIGVAVLPSYRVEGRAVVQIRAVCTALGVSAAPEIEAQRAAGRAVLATIPGLPRGAVACIEVARLHEWLGGEPLG